MNVGRLKHLAIKRVKDQNRFHVLLTPHKVHFGSSSNTVIN